MTHTHAHQATDTLFRTMEMQMPQENKKHPPYPNHPDFPGNQPRKNKNSVLINNHTDHHVMMLAAQSKEGNK
jgi:hypothetical protein